jgi:hypothetical protein
MIGDLTGVEETKSGQEKEKAAKEQRRNGKVHLLAM